jgi:uncharacterized protein (DUF302 family)
MTTDTHVELPALSASCYALRRALPPAAFEATVERVRTALAAEGFGIVTTLDVAATMHAKLGVALRPYLILGACNPKLALEALLAEPGVGVLLPCNVAVVEEAAGVVVAAVDPIAQFAVLGRPEIEPFAVAVRDRLARALATL